MIFTSKFFSPMASLKSFQLCKVTDGKKYEIQYTKPKTAIKYRSFFSLFNKINNSSAYSLKNSASSISSQNIHNFTNKNTIFRNTVVFAGRSNLPLANAIAHNLGITLGKIKLERFADGEVNLQFLESLRAKNVYLIQATSPPVNENLVELLLMISTSRRSSAKRITVVIPYYGYARQVNTFDYICCTCRIENLTQVVPISAADVARIIEIMGVDRVISVDLHSGQIQGFFGPRVPVDNLEAQLTALDYFAEKKLVNPVIVSPDAGGVYRARKFQEGLRSKKYATAEIAMLIKQRSKPNEVEKMDLVGNVKGCDVIIVDDIIDTAGTLCEAASQLKQAKANRVFAFATHGLFSKTAIEKLEKSCIEEVVVTDTIQLTKV